MILVQSDNVYVSTYVIGQKYFGLDARIDCTEKQFKDFIQRAANLNPDICPGLKIFADAVTNGTILQDYYSQVVKKKITNELPATLS